MRSHHLWTCVFALLRHVRAVAVSTETTATFAAGLASAGSSAGGSSPLLIARARTYMTTCMQTEAPEISVAYRAVYCATKMHLKDETSTSSSSDSTESPDSGEQGEQDLDQDLARNIKPKVVAVVDLLLGWGGFMEAVWRAGGEFHFEKLNENAQRDPVSGKYFATQIPPKMIYAGFEKERWNMERLLYHKTSQLCETAGHYLGEDYEQGICDITFVDLVTGGSKVPPKEEGDDGAGELSNHAKFWSALEAAAGTSTRSGGSAGADDGTVELGVPIGSSKRGKGKEASTASRGKNALNQKELAAVRSVVSALEDVKGMRHSRKQMLQERDLADENKNLLRGLDNIPHWMRLVDLVPVRRTKIDAHINTSDLLVQPGETGFFHSVLTAHIKDLAADRLGERVREQKKGTKGMSAGAGGGTMVAMNNFPVFEFIREQADRCEGKRNAIISATLFWGTPYPVYLSEKVGPTLWGYTSPPWEKKQEPIVRDMLRLSYKTAHIAQVCNGLRSKSLPILAFVDTGSAMGPEFTLIETFCRPDLVYLNNINLPNHPGWIRTRLLESGFYEEVFQASYNDDEAMEEDDFVHAKVYGRRVFCVLKRIGGGRAGEEGVANSSPTETAPRGDLGKPKDEDL